MHKRYSKVHPYNNFSSYKIQFKIPFPKGVFYTTYVVTLLYHSVTYWWYYHHQNSQIRKNSQNTTNIHNNIYVRMKSIGLDCSEWNTKNTGTVRYPVPVVLKLLYSWCINTHVRIYGFLAIKWNHQFRGDFHRALFRSPPT